MIDFRSDTVTKPTKKMRESMMEAIVGDDVYQDDPTIIRLEEEAARITNKEAALFVTSGTMGNQLAIYAHTKRGDEIIVGKKSHIKNYEVGASAVISGVSYHIVEEIDHLMPLEEIRSGIRGIDIHYPDTTLICLENAHGNGKVLPVDYMADVKKIALDNQLKVHLDGARLFNAATALGVAVSDITNHVDTVTFCLSKGLAAPVGSLLCGSKQFIDRARRGRKLLGGGMRQVGVLGAPGLIALNEMSKRLQVDHDNARYLAKKLHEIPGFEVDFDHLDINLVFAKSVADFDKLAVYLKGYGIIIGGYQKGAIRLACHNDIKKEDIDLLISKIAQFMEV